VVGVQKLIFRFRPLLELYGRKFFFSSLSAEAQTAEEVEFVLSPSVEKE